MANSIGALSFDLLRGMADEPAEATESWARPGIDYQTHRRIGYRARQIELRTVAIVADATAAAVEAAAYKAVQGTSLDIIDATGVTWANCRVLEVRATWRNCIYQGAAKTRLAARWTVVQDDPAG